MKKVYDDYRSYTAQGDCYKYIHECANCGEVLAQIPDYEYHKYPERAGVPNYCSYCGARQRRQNK